MPRRPSSPNPWKDCPDPSCGWRNYAEASVNTNPVRVEAFAITTWTPATRCRSCGAELDEAVKVKAG